MMDELVTGAEIGRRLGVSRERVRQWAAAEGLGFPHDLGRFGSVRLWRWDEVERWARERAPQRRRAATSRVRR